MTWRDSSSLSTTTIGIVSISKRIAHRSIVAPRTPRTAVQRRAHGPRKRHATFPGVPCRVAHAVVGSARSAQARREAQMQPRIHGALVAWSHLECAGSGDVDAARDAPRHAGLEDAAP